MVFSCSCLLKPTTQDFAGQTLEVTVWDKDQRSKDDFMGRFAFPFHDIEHIDLPKHVSRCSVDLHNMEREVIIC